MFDLDIEAPHKARAVVVLVHGYQGFKDWGFFPWLGEQLCAEGHVAVRVTLPDDRYTAQVRDLTEVTRHVHHQFRGLPLFLIGHSRGGGVALLASPDIEGLEGVVTWSAIARADRWGDLDVSGTDVLADFEANRERLDILASAARLHVPLLGIHGGRDASVPVSDSEAIVERAPDGSLVVIQTASHTFNAIHPLVHVPRELQMAAALTTHFVSAYS